MSLRLRCSALMLMLGLGFSGCTPTAETQVDEQKNPHYQAGMSKLSALDYKGAVESFERAVEDNPRSALAHFELGVIFDQHEPDYAAALYHYNKALKLRPNGYPAENIKQRIPACKQELVKADSLSVMNPGALRETEDLRKQNETLRKQAEALQSYIATRLATPGSPSGVPTDVGKNNLRSFLTSTNSAAIMARVDSSGVTRGTPSLTTNQSRILPAGGSGRARTHSIRAGDTPYSIARQYQIKVGSLLSANPGLDPKKMRVGQVLNIPAS